MVPKDRELRNQILDESHSSKLSINGNGDPDLLSGDGNYHCGGE